MSFFSSCLLALTVLNTSVLMAQSLTWQAVNGPPGGQVYSIMRHDNRIVIGGDYRLFLSTDEGATWANSGDGISGYRTNALARDSSGTLYAATEPGQGSQGGVFHSTDNGRTWTVGNTGMEGIFETAALASDHFGNIFAGTRGSGLFRSTDHGVRWARATLRDDRDSVVINPYVVQFSGTPDGTLFALTTRGAFRSTDSGHVWRLAGKQYSLAVGPTLIIDRQGVLYEGFLGSIDSSANGGVTWGRMVNHDRNMIAFAITHAGTFLGKRNDTLFRSVDRGATWQPAPVDRYLYLYYDFNMEHTGEILAGTNQGVYRSRDDARTWESLNQHLVASSIVDLAADSSGSIIAVAAGQGIFRTTDAGTSWSNLGPAGNGKYPGYYYTYHVATDERGHLYTFSLDSLHVSTDAGATWHVASPGDAPVEGGTMVTRPGGLAIALLKDGGFGARRIARSHDYGATWETISIFPSGVRFRLLMLPNGHLFAGTENNMVYSLDSGVTWKNRSFKDPDNRPTYALAYTQSGNLLAATSTGLWSTSNEGITWKSIGIPFRMDSVRRLITLRNGNMLAVVSPLIFTSSNDGVTWDTATAGIPQIEQAVESANGDLYAGVIGLGVFRSAHIMEVPKPRPASSAIMIRGAEYRGAGQVAIRYTLPKSGTLRIGLFNEIGESVATTTVADAASGESTVDLASGPIVPGWYLCRVCVGEECTAIPLIIAP